MEETKPKTFRSKLRKVAIAFLILLAIVVLAGGLFYVWYTSSQRISQLEQELAVAEENVALTNQEESESQAVETNESESDEVACLDQSILSSPIKFTVPCNWHVYIVNGLLDTNTSGYATLTRGTLASRPLISLYATEGTSADIHYNIYRYDTPNGIDTKLALYPAGSITSYTTDSGLEFKVADTDKFLEWMGHDYLYVIGINTSDGKSLVVQFDVPQIESKAGAREVFLEQIIESFGWYSENDILWM